MAKDLFELIADLAHDELPFSEIHLVEGAPVALKLPGGLRDLCDEGPVPRVAIEQFLEVNALGDMPDPEPTTLGFFQPVLRSPRP